MKRLAVLACLALASSVQAQHTPPAAYDVIADVPYCTGGGKPLLMDVFVPRARLATPTPAVLWLHGGGWERGDKNGNSGARFLAKAGFVTASIYYRLSGEAKFPANIEDCKCAVRYLRANAAKYGIDRDAIGVAGSSAGGHLALLVGMARKAADLEGAGGWRGVSSRVAAVASYYGPTDLTKMQTDFGARAQAAITKLIGGTPDEFPLALRRASPVSYIAPGDPPILLVHGTGDTLVPFAQSARLYDRYKRAHLDATLVRVDNANHDFEPVDKTKPLSINVDTIHAETIAFFEQHLLAPGQR